MMLTSTLERLSIGDAGVIALLGYSVVFFGLILLMGVITVLGKVMTASTKKAAAAAVVTGTAAPAAAPAAPVAAAEAPAAPGSAGPVKLYDTPPKTAAMIMAIVANQMGKPLNELRFISIKEVK